MTPLEALKGIRALTQAVNSPILDDKLQRLLLSSILSVAQKGLIHEKKPRDITDDQLLDVLRKSGVQNPEELTEEQLEAIAEGMSGKD